MVHKCCIFTTVGRQAALLGAAESCGDDARLGDADAMGRDSGGAVDDLSTVWVTAATLPAEAPNSGTPPSIFSATPGRRPSWNPDITRAGRADQPSADAVRWEVRREGRPGTHGEWFWDRFRAYL